MVFPSRGCQTCKKRRVKCDAVQPICSGCQKGQRTCTWNPIQQDHQGLLFRSENSFAQGQPRRPRRAKGFSRQPISLTQPSPPNIPITLSTPIEVHAFQYWVENFMFQVDDLPDIGHEYGIYVLSHWNSARQGSSLRLAFSALSHAVFGRARRVDKAMEDASRAHAQSIVRTQEEMKEVSNESIDQLLLSIMLMGTYENIMYGSKKHYTGDSPDPGADEVGSRLWKAVCHHKGAAGLLKLRRQQGFPPNLPLDKVVRRQIIRICILRGITIPPWLLDGAEYGEEGPALEIDSLMIRVAALRAKSLALFGGEKSLFPVTTEEAAAEAQDLDKALSSWSQAVPDDWKFSSQPYTASLESFETDLLYNGPVHIYRTHGHACVWNRYRAARLIVNSIGNRSFSNLQQCSSQRLFAMVQQAICQRNIESLANELCGSVSFFFNSPNATGEGAESRSIKIGGNIIKTESEILPKMAGLLAWPLTVAVSTDGVPQPQRQWLKRRLKTVAISFGDAVLESVVEQGQFRF